MFFNTLLRKIFFSFLILVVIPLWYVLGNNTSIVCARFDTNLEIINEEKNFMRKRDTITQAHLLARTEKLFAHGFDAGKHRLPRIAFCFSGGGNRALIASLGFMQGAEKIGLLDCTSYASFLSGSSWFYISFLLKNMSHNMGLQDYKNFLQPRLEKPFKRDPRKFFAEIRQIKKTKRSPTISDGWGRIVYDYLLGDTVDSYASFKDIRSHLISSGENMPFPLFTAIIKNVSPYTWLEVSPFCLGSNELGGYIPTNYFGSVFTRGFCTDVLPEISLASFMGIFGSAYCLNSTELTTAFKSRLLPALPLFQQPGKTPQELFPQSERFSGFRSYWSRRVQLGIKLMPNPIESNSAFNNFSTINSSRLVIADAGIDFNIPTPPLLRKQRDIDIIVICDASYKKTKTLNNLIHLKKAQKHAEKHGIPFPPLSNPIKLAHNIWVFEDQDPAIPTIIYFRSSATTGTLKFSYTTDEFDSICNEACNTLVATQDGIFEAITRKTRILNRF